jgi:hypothetical protein
VPLTFRAGPGLDLGGLAAGDSVRVSYRAGRVGTLIARSFAYTDARTALGTLVSLDADHSTFTLQTTAGSLTFTDDSGLVDDSQLGDQLAVTYTARPTGLAARIVKDVAHATVLEASGTITDIPDDQSSLAVQTAAGQTLTISTEDPTLLDDFSVGDDVQVSYIQVGAHLIARDVEPLDDGTLSASATITAIAPDGSTFTAQTDDGQTLTIQANPDDLEGFAVGDQVDITYKQDASGVLTEQDIEPA